MKLAVALCLIVILSECQNTTCSAQIWVYKRGNTQVSAFGNEVGLLAQTQNDPVYKGRPNWFSHEKVREGDTSYIEGGWLVTAMGNKLLVNSPDRTYTTWIKGAGPVSHGWKPTGYWPSKIETWKLVDTIVINQAKRQFISTFGRITLVFEQNEDDFIAYVEQDGKRSPAGKTYVTEQLILAAKHLSHVKNLYSRHSAELAAILKLQNELKDVPRIGTTTAAGLAAKTAYTEASLKNALQLLYNRKWGDNDRIYLSDLSATIEKILYGRRE